LWSKFDSFSLKYKLSSSNFFDAFSIRVGDRETVIEGVNQIRVQYIHM